MKAYASIYLWLLAHYACLAMSAGETNGVISISYGLQGQDALYTYRIAQRPTNQELTYALSSKGKPVVAGRLQSGGPVEVLARGLFKDFNEASMQFQETPTTDGPIKSIRITYTSAIFRQEVSITASERDLQAFIASTHAIRALLQVLSADKPKLFRLWDDPGPLKQFMPPSLGKD